MSKRSFDVNETSIDVMLEISILSIEYTKFRTFSVVSEYSTEVEILNGNLECDIHISHLDNFILSEFDFYVWTTKISKTLNSEDIESYSVLKKKYVTFDGSKSYSSILGG